MPTRKILILFAHPALEKSRVNRVLAGAVQDLPGVSFHDLYEEYPNFYIDIKREQDLLEKHDLFIAHHPFFWYSTPAILKEWQDLVLEHGWAYGTGGTALRGKLMFNTITTGGREVAYTSEGYNRFTMNELLVPISQTARLCGIDYLPPFIVHGTHAMKPDEIEAHARDYRRFVEALRDGSVDLDVARTLPRINMDLDRIIVSRGKS